MQKTLNCPPDIESASEDYRCRFVGEVGEFFLEIQAKTVLSLLPVQETHPLKILEIGGGHGQLVNHLLNAGHKVWVHGSNAEALQRVALIKDREAHLHLVESSMYEIPFDDAFFDVVLSVRVLAHVNDPEILLKEWTRVAKQRVIFDYPPLESFNILYPLLFKIKKILEKNTRTFEIYRSKVFNEIFEKLGWQVVETKKQFLIPMVFHRKLNHVRFSRLVEKMCYQSKLTSLFGSPALISAKRK